jgi:CrcB protein
MSMKGVMLDYVLVFVGGGIGSALRHGVNVAFVHWFGTRFPFHTLFDNVSGSLVMGLLAGHFAFGSGTSQHLWLFLTTGIIGGYTTFSAFSLDTVLLCERGQWRRATGYVLTSVLASIFGLVLGLAMVRQLT